jgi:predicted metal-binding membrane protein
MPSAGPWGGADLVLVALMWVAMALAMMLPTAGPMVLTYAEIADTAAGKGERVVSPFFLAGGYVTVWIGFALAAALLQGLLTRASLLDPSMRSAGLMFSGEIFVGAGLYQFSSLKRACLTQCQRPFPFFFANWTTQARGVFTLGLRQGLHCLGCCWALMLVMLAVGVMNVAWMAGLAIVMAAEKLTTTPWFSRLVGAAFVVIGLGFLLAYVEAYWPAWSVIERV